MKLLGIDTSNYTTSCAWYDPDAQTMMQRKQLLPVPAGQAGLRQSDAVFHHTRQLPALIEQLAADAGGALMPQAVGVSVSPRSAEGSYMPCFLAGAGSARILAAAAHIPLHQTSHQMGHILAALYSAGCLSWVKPCAAPFLAFHVSGGTTDCVKCTPDAENVLLIEPVSESLDLKAGQAVDRVGLMLGLQFPCGAALEQLAMQSSSTAKMQVHLKDGCCSLSGLQNQCEQMLKKQVPAADIARYCLNSIAAVLTAMTKDAAKQNGDPAVLYAGGVLSDKLIQDALAKLPLQTAFAEPAFSCDNAAGIAVYAARKELPSCLF
ncbi:MAG: peptidase M22 [Oscillospiraceae bacterium]|nr:peptidase M22 [Oscillospiraceae bacterium]